MNRAVGLYLAITWPQVPKKKGENIYLQIWVEIVLGLRFLLIFLVNLMTIYSNGQSY